jgi:phenol hydroxylase P5 protein
MPRFRAQRHTLVVKDVVDISPTTYVVRFVMDNGEEVFDFQPGQFLSIFAEKEGRAVSRPYSIASPPHEKEHLELCIKVVEGGFMSNYLHRVAPRTKLRAMGPLGRFILLEPILNDIAFVATGTGVAPFVCMLKHIFHRGTNFEMHLFFGVRYVRELIYRDLFEVLAKEHDNFHFHPTISRPETPEWEGRVGYVQKAIEEEIEDPSNMHAYICGLHKMVEETKNLCEGMGFPLVRFEKWD